MSSDKTKQRDLLRAVLQERSTHLLPLIDKLGKQPLSSGEREEIKRVIAEEITSSGIDETGEINQRGIDLDDLISLIARS